MMIVNRSVPVVFTVPSEEMHGASVYIARSRYFTASCWRLPCRAKQCRAVRASPVRGYRVHVCTRHGEKTKPRHLYCKI